MDTCAFCRYRRDNDNQNSQTCSRWVNEDNENEFCNSEGVSMGDEPNEPENNECIRETCPAHCQYPYPKGMYEGDLYPEEYHNDNDRVRYTLDENEKTNYLSISSTPDNKVQDIYTNSEYFDLPNQELLCGEMVLPLPGTFMNIPNLPNFSQAEEGYNKNKGINTTGRQWDKIKLTPLLVNTYGGTINETNTVVTIDGISVPLDVNGIEIEWWNTSYSEEDLKNILPDTIRDFMELEEIHKTTGQLLENVFPTHTVGNMVAEEMYDWLEKRNFTINMITSSDDNLTGSSSSNIKQLTMASFFNVSPLSVVNPEFEICMNDLMMTDHDDQQHMGIISTMKHFSDLGEDVYKTELDYIESKVIKFILIKSIDIKKCLDIVHITEKVCETGLSKNVISIIGVIFDMEVSDIDEDKYKINLDNVSKRLSKYLPNLLYKLIDISEHYEKYKCNGKVNPSTNLLKEVYMSLITKNKYDNNFYSSMGIDDFFKSFQKNMITKVILLVFIGFIISKIIGLFKFQYSINK